MVKMPEEPHRRGMAPVSAFCETFSERKFWYMPGKFGSMPLQVPDKLPVRRRKQHG